MPMRPFGLRTMSSTSLAKANYLVRREITSNFALIRVKYYDRRNEEAARRSREESTGQGKGSTLEPATAETGHQAGTGIVEAGRRSESGEPADAEPKFVRYTAMKKRSGSKSSLPDGCHRQW